MASLSWKIRADTRSVAFFTLSTSLLKRPCPSILRWCVKKRLHEPKKKFKVKQNNRRIISRKARRTRSSGEPVVADHHHHHHHHHQVKRREGTRPVAHHLVCAKSEVYHEPRAEIPDRLGCRALKITIALIIGLKITC